MSSFNGSIAPYYDVQRCLRLSGKNDHTDQITNIHINRQISPEEFWKNYRLLTHQNAEALPESAIKVVHIDAETCRAIENLPMDIYNNVGQRIGQKTFTVIFTKGLGPNLCAAIDKNGQILTSI